MDPKSILKKTENSSQLAYNSQKDNDAGLPGKNEKHARLDLKTATAKVLQRRKPKMEDIVRLKFQMKADLKQELYQTLYTQLRRKSVAPTMQTPDMAGRRKRAETVETVQMGTINPSYTEETDATAEEDEEDWETGWHEQESKKELLKEYKSKYGRELTFHGLSRIYNGGAWERVFWITSLLIAVALSTYVCYTLVDKYYERETVTDSSIESSNRLQFPSITVCSKDIHATKAICNEGNYSYYEGDQIVTEPCYNTTNILRYQLQSCYHAEGKSDSCSTDYAILEDGQCITLNPDGKIYQRIPYTSGRLEYVIKVFPPYPTNKVRTWTASLLYMHKEHEPPIITYKGMYNILYAGRQYHLRIARTHIKRLPAPYKSNCTNTNVTSRNYFSEKFNYTQTTCTETCYMINMLKKCGAVGDLWRPYLPAAIIERYNKTNMTHEEKSACMSDFYANDYFNYPVDCDECPMKCEETQFKILSIEVFRYRTDLMKLVVWYDNLEYRTITEKVAYTGSQFIADFGGLMGLVAGGSVLSILELFVFFALIVASRTIK